MNRQVWVIKKEITNTNQLNSGDVFKLVDQKVEYSRDDIDNKLLLKIENPITGHNLRTPNGWVSAYSDIDIDNKLDMKLDTTSIVTNLILYPTTTISDIPSVYRMVSDMSDDDYDDIFFDSPTPLLLVTPTLISTYVSDVNIFVGNTGVINLSLMGNIKKTSLDPNSFGVFFFKVYKTDINGDELLTTSLNSCEITSSNYVQLFITALLPNTNFISTDRIKIEYYGFKTGSGSDPSFDIQIGGSMPFRTSVPMPSSIGSVIPKLNISDYILPLNDTKSFLLQGINLDVVTSITTSNPSDVISFVVIDQSKIELTINAKMLGNLSITLNSFHTYDDYFTVIGGEGWTILDSMNYPSPNITSLMGPGTNWSQSSEGIKIGQISATLWGRYHKFDDFVIDMNQTLEFIINLESLSDVTTQFTIGMIDPIIILSGVNSYGSDDILGSVGVTFTYTKESDPVFISKYRSELVFYRPNITYPINQMMRILLNKDKLEIWTLNPNDPLDYTGELLHKLFSPKNTHPDGLVPYFNIQKPNVLDIIIKAFRIL